MVCRGACFDEGIYEAFPIFPALVLIQLEGGVYLFWSDRKNDNGGEKLPVLLVVANYLLGTLCGFVLRCQIIEKLQDPLLFPNHTRIFDSEVSRSVDVLSQSRHLCRVAPVF